MQILLRIWAIFIVAIKHLLSQWWLALSTTLGLLAVMMIVLSIPLYTDAIYYRILQEELSSIAEKGKLSEPLFAFLFRYAGSSEGAVEWEDIQHLDAYLRTSAAADLGLPQKFMTQYVQTDRLGIFPLENAGYLDTTKPLTWASFAYVSDLKSRVTLIEGEWPDEASEKDNNIVGVLVNEALAEKLGLQVGEEYIAYIGISDMRQQSVTIPVRLSGVWEAVDPQNEFWIYNPGALYNELVVAGESFAAHISPFMDDEVNLALWHFSMDSANFHTEDVIPLFRQINSVHYKAFTFLPGTRLIVPAEGYLRRYWESVNLLTFLLYIFSVPIVGLILVFIGMVMRLSTAQRQNEIATLRSRGATTAQVLGIAALECLMLGGIALIIGLPAGMQITRFMGQAKGFLDFTLHTDMHVSITLNTLRQGIIITAFSIIMQAFLTFSATSYTIISYKQEQARSLRAPWWQRAGLDLLLLIPTVYGANIIRMQGSITLPFADNGGMYSDPFQNPLLILVPTLGIFTLTLLMLRLIPAIMAGIAQFTAHLNWVGALLASLHLSRSPSFYTAPLVLLVITLSLSTFTSSLAQTLDSHLDDQMYYRYGADMHLIERGKRSEGQNEQQFAQLLNGGTETKQGSRWFFPLVSEHLDVTGVLAATRVGRYAVMARTPGKVQPGTILAIDRTDFPMVTFWREDFALDALGTLMNKLAVHPEGVLVHKDYMSQHVLQVGDRLNMLAIIEDMNVELDMQIVGSFDLFPTWYPESERGYEPLFVGNLDYLFERAESQFPYDVWLKTSPDADHEQIVTELRNMQFSVISWDAPPVEIAKSQQHPERQGLFGLLSVGFLATALLTVLGFLLYAFYSYRQRFIEMGMLRAIGLSTGQMTAFLAWELAFLILIGGTIGTGLGVWVSKLFIPYLHVGTDITARIPPFVVSIAWNEIFRIHALFGVLFTVALTGLAVLLVRMKIYKAIKLGETL